MADAAAARDHLDNGWQRRLKHDWKPLHKPIYPAALLDAIHYLWLVEADTQTPVIYFFGFR
ncbi:MULTISPECIES: cytochrome b family protein [Methylocaldum]|uniref:hypothetical protein n=1 Tax=unclassified Methylocaldum TaxID=2622260 RepID=UPI001B67BEA7|nr:hypothetical protein [Methylocaldum sp. RMAD-M]MBP1152251.1 DMSO/TMAO reductase YedYZ heme-binding membrane subunit [Methylocaldum sp. RMAD-M]MDV3240403.1 hypothetical protein [Methylocaldum sp.]